MNGTDVEAQVAACVRWADAAGAIHAMPADDQRRAALRDLGLRRRILQKPAGRVVVDVDEPRRHREAPPDDQRRADPYLAQRGRVPDHAWRRYWPQWSALTRLGTDPAPGPSAVTDLDSAHV